MKAAFTCVFNVQLIIKIVNKELRKTHDTKGKILFLLHYLISKYFLYLLIRICLALTTARKPSNVNISFADSEIQPFDSSSDIGCDHQ